MEINELIQTAKFQNYAQDIDPHAFKYRLFVELFLNFSLTLTVSAVTGANPNSGLKGEAFIHIFNSKVGKQKHVVVKVVVSSLPGRMGRWRRKG